MESMNITEELNEISLKNDQENGLNTTLEEKVFKNSELQFFLRFFNNTVSLPLYHHYRYNNRYIIIP